MAPGVNPSELTGGGLSWICPCTRAATSYSVNTATGEFYHSFTDLAIPGRGIPLQFGRTYSSQLASTLGSLGYGWTDTYAMSVTVTGSLGTSGSTAVVTAMNGSTSTFTSNGTAWVGPAHILATLTQAGSPVVFTFTDKGKTLYSFNAAGQLTAITDANGYQTTFAYNGSNQLTTITDPASRTLTIAYSGSLIQSVTDSSTPARSVSFTYDGSNNLIQATDVRGNVTKFTYDGSHQMLNMKDPNCVAAGNQCNGVQNTYSSGKVTQQVDNLGRITTFSYATTVLGTTTTVTDPNGNVTREEYAANVLVSETTAYGTSAAATTTYAFDPGTLGVTGVTDPNGNSSVVSRDSQANVLSSTDALGRTSTATYNSFNEVLVATDPLGAATTNTYDANGNLTQTSTPLVGSSPAVSRTTVYTYGDGSHPGDVTQMTDPDGKNWAYTYDTYGDRASASDPLSPADKVTYAFDSAGRLTSKVTPLGNVSGGTPANYTYTYTYDAANEVLTASDPLGNQARTPTTPTATWPTRSTSAAARPLTPTTSTTREQPRPTGSGALQGAPSGLPSTATATCISRSTAWAT